MSTEKPKGADEFDEAYWRAFRARARKRTSMQMMLVIGPFGIAVALFKILEPMRYSAGDMRNSLEFRLVVYGAAILFVLALMIVAVRWLWSDRRSST